MKAQQRIPALDGLRAVAIAAVMFSHGLLMPATATRPMRAMGYLAGHLGGLGVALFFAISGYLITSLLLEDQNLRGFYIRRAWRILPAAYLYLMAVAIIHSFRRGELASAVFFYSNYWADRSWYTAHFWSLSIEEHFYLLWPVLLVCLNARRALIAASVLISITALWRPWSLAHTHLPYPALQRTDMRLDALLFAGILAILLHGPYRPHLLRVLTASWFRVLSALTLLAAWTWALAGSAPATGTLIETALLPGILVSLVHWPGSAIFWFLESAPLRWIGRISYGLYLWQQLFLTPGGGALLPRVALTFAAAATSYYLMERPLLRYCRAPGRNWNRQVLWNNEFFAENAERYPRLRQEV
ncbi:MAG: acyltransferase [Acidobacteriota bacterium]|nr:acyltransferase [Acidobacteriota bacterium]